MANDNDKLKARAEAAELKLRAATASAQLRLVRGAAGGPAASATSYRPGPRTGGYAVATETRRAGAKRFAGGGADRHLTPAQLASVRNACRDMARNNPVGAALVSRVADIVIGDGLRLQSGSVDKDWNTFVERRWEAWLDTAVVNGRMDGLALQRWMIGQYVEAGDCAIVKYGDEAGPELAGRIHLVEAEQIDAGAKAGLYPYGVDRTEYGALRTLFVRTWAKGGAPGPVAEVDGAHVVMVENLRRTSQSRGEPELASSLESIDDQFELYQNNLAAAKLAATLPIVTQTDSPKGFEKAMLGERKNNGYGSGGAALEPGDSKEMELSTGVNLLNLGRGENAQGLKSEFPQTSVVGFGEAMQGMSSAVCGIPVNILMLNFAPMSYFSGRMALYVAYICCKPKRKVAARALGSLYDWKLAGWMNEWKKMGKTVPADWRERAFVDPAPPSLDPVKDVQAAILRVNNNFTTKAFECDTLTGQDFDRVVVQRGLEVDAEADNGVVPPLAPGAQGGGSPDGGRGGEADSADPKEEGAKGGAV